MAGDRSTSRRGHATRPVAGSWRLALGGVLLLTAVASATGWSITSTRSELRDAKVERLRERAEVNARYVAAFLDELDERLHSIAPGAARASSPARLRGIVDTTAFDELVVRLPDGGIAAAHPRRDPADEAVVSDGVWTPTQATDGSRAVVMTVGATGGARVEGLVRLHDSDLAEFLDIAPPAGRVVRVLLDADRQPVAAHGSMPSGLLEALADTAADGRVEVANQTWLVFEGGVAHAPLSVVLTMSETELYGDLVGWQGRIAWLPWVLMVAAGLTATGVLVGLRGQRESLAAANRSLSRRERAAEASATIAEAANAAERLDEALPAFERALGSAAGTARIEVVHPWASPRPGGAVDAETDEPSTAVPEGSAYELVLPVALPDEALGVLVVRMSDLPDDIDPVLRVLASSTASLLQREQVIDDLRRSNAELEQFAYLASHDLQEPLRKVASYCRLLERRYTGQLDEDADELIGYAVDGATRMQQLVQDLLQYSRAGRVELHRDRVELGELVDQVLRDLELRVTETAATVEVGPDLPAVDGDPRMLGQVLQNVLDNALKFHGDAPARIRIAGTVDGGRAHLVVADEGIGIPEECREQVFGLFQRLHGRSEYGGTGLGLAICRRIVERHGGAIHVAPGVPSGTEVHLDLPAVADHPTLTPSLEEVTP